MEWTIKEAAKITGLSTDTLRYYDKEGFVIPKRKDNGYRYYDETEIMILKNIVVMKYAHFTLNEMKAMEEIFRQEENAECNEITRQILTAKARELRQKAKNFQQIIRLLEQLLAMVDSTEAYLANQDQVTAFIDQIFAAVRSGDTDSLLKEEG